MRHPRAPLIVAGIVFTLVALGHIFRLVHHWTVVIGGMIVPESVSVVGTIVAVILAIWMFSAAACKNKNKK